MKISQNSQGTAVLPVTTNIAASPKSRFFNYPISRETKIALAAIGTVASGLLVAKYFKFNTLINLFNKTNTSTGN